MARIFRIVVRTAGLLLPLSLLLGPLPARAQATAHFVAGGGVVVSGHGSEDAVWPGYQVEVGVEAGRPESSVAFRLEGLYDRLSSGVTLVPPCPLGVTCRGTTLHERRIGGTLDVVVTGSATTSPLVPYLVGGLGAYWHDLSGAGGSGTAGTTGFGVNLGVGARMPRIHAFVELDVHLVSSAANCVPLTVGLRL